MTKTNKLSTGILALAIMLLCSLQGWAQTGKAVPSLGASQALSSPSQEKFQNPAALTDKADSPGAQLNDLRKVLLTKQAELEKGLAENSLSEKDKSVIKEKIANIEAQIQPLLQNASGPKSNSRQEAMKRRTQQPRTRLEASEYMKQHPDPVRRPSQSDKETSLANASVSGQQEVKMDSPVEELNVLRYELNSVKQEFELAKTKSKLNAEEVAAFNEKIASYDSKIKALLPMEKELLKGKN